MKTVSEYRYFDVRCGELEPGRKTLRYVLVNKRARARIGTIEWYAPWRQFCFFPGPETVWSDGCLVSVRDFVGRITEQRRMANAGKGATDES